MPSLMRSSLAVGAGTLTSRVLGFLRDLVVARLFGADLDTDAFFVAFKVPNLFRRLFAEGAFSLAFVPALAEQRTHRGIEGLKGFLDQVTGTLGGALLGVTALGVVGAPLLILLFAPGFVADPGKQALATDLLRLTLPYLWFVALTALAGSVLNLFQRFAVPAFTPVLLNLSLIGCALWLAPLLERPILALGWGVLLAGALQLALQWPFLGQMGLVPRPRWAPGDPPVRQLMRRMGPALFGASVAQIGLVLETLFASFLEEGNISWLYYASRLVEFPQGILGAAIGTVILPSLSQQHAARSPEAFSQTLDGALRWALLLGLPAAVGLVVLARPIMVTLLHYGAFSAADVEMSARALMAYAVGLLAALGIRALLPGYYARGDVRAPVKIALLALGLNLGLNLLLMGPMGHTGLALAASLAALLNGGLLLGGLLRGGVFRPQPGWWLRLLRAGLAVVAMAGVLLALSGEGTVWLVMSGRDRLLGLGGLVLTGLATYGLVLVALGERLRPRPLAGHSGRS